jgi:uncharacterized protein YcbK (DUF882 family)
VDLWQSRWPDFKPEEILSPDSIARYPHKLCPHSLDTLQTFRRLLGVKLVINFGSSRLRGVRTVDENSRIPGSAHESMHICGRAFDVSSPDMTPREIFSRAIDSGLWGGIKLYGQWVHLDTRYAPHGPWIENG